MSKEYDGNVPLQTEIRGSTKQMLKYASFRQQIPMYKLVDMAIRKFFEEDKELLEAVRQHEASIKGS